MTILCIGIDLTVMRHVLQEILRGPASEPNCRDLAGSELSERPDGLTAALYDDGAAARADEGAGVGTLGLTELSLSGLGRGPGGR